MKRRAFLVMLSALFLPWRKQAEHKNVFSESNEKLSRIRDTRADMLKSLGAPEVECGGVRYLMLIGQDGKAQFYAYNTSGVPFRMKV